MPQKILISSCLTGEKCAYDGKARTDKKLIRALAGHELIRVCPEMFGGLGTPRERHEITDGTGEDVLLEKARVISASGKDRTESFIRGAQKTLETARQNGIKVAILKSRSPSCGTHTVFSGKFDGSLKEGAGVTTALLHRHGIQIYTENDFLASYPLPSDSF